MAHHLRHHSRIVVKTMSNRLDSLAKPIHRGALNPAPSAPPIEIDAPCKVFKLCRALFIFDRLSTHISVTHLPAQRCLGQIQVSTTTMTQKSRLRPFGYRRLLSAEIQCLVVAIDQGQGESRHSARLSSVLSSWQVSSSGNPPPKSPLSRLTASARFTLPESSTSQESAHGASKLPRYR